MICAQSTPCDAAYLAKASSFCINTARTTLAEKQRRMRDNILQEIRETVKARVKTGGYTLVVDTAAETMNGTPIVLYSAGTDDLTDSVLSQLNINAPPPPAGKSDAK